MDRVVCCVYGLFSISTEKIMFGKVKHRPLSRHGDFSESRRAMVIMTYEIRGSSDNT